jgi:hypothetical protein
MGFRHLHLFNKAMLEKRDLSLDRTADVLECSRVDISTMEDFMRCTRKKHASHTWRSILAGREVLERGLIKRIGDGSSTNIWRDRWIPMHFDGKPITPSADQELNQV